MDRPTTVLCRTAADTIHLREKDLVEELIGKVSFTDGLFFLIVGRVPSRAETGIVDAVLVTLMEHGLTPSAIATRMVYMSAPEALQSAVAAGLLAVGSQFVGSMEAAARLLAEVVSAGDDGVAAARRIADRHRADGRPVPGFGHPLHRPDDPRTPRLFALAEEAGVPGRHIAAIRELGRAVDAAAGRHLTINATGAIAAVLSEIGPPAEILRGFAVISRAAGLVAHIREEQGTPAGRHIWAAADRAVPYTQARASRR